MTFISLQSYAQEEVEREWTPINVSQILIEQWRDAGRADVHVNTLPEGVAEELGIESETIPPEILFSQEMQEALTRVFELPDTPRMFPIEEFSMNPRREQLDFLRDDLSLEELKERYSNHLGIDDVEELTPEMIDKVTKLHTTFVRLRGQMEQHEAELNEHLHLHRHVSEIGDENGSPNSNFIRGDVEQAWNALTSDDQIQLEPLRHLRDQRKEFITNLTDEQFDAGMRYIRNLDVLSPPTMVLQLREQFSKPSAIAERLEERIKERGFAVQPNDIAPTESARRMIDSTKTDSFSSFASSLMGQSIRPLLDSLDSTEYSHSISSLDPTYILQNSENYVIDNGDEMRQYYSETLFGGAMIISRLRVAGGGIYFPNLLIAGRDAKVLATRYRDEQWNTAIHAFGNQYRYRFYIEGRLEGELLSNFIEMATQLVEAENLGLRN